MRVSEYNQLKGQLAVLNRKRTGNLAVRDLAGLVDKVRLPLHRFSTLV